MDLTSDSTKTHLWKEVCKWRWSRNMF